VTAEYRDVGSASIDSLDPSDDQPLKEVQNRTPHEAFLSFAVDLRNHIGGPAIEFLPSLSAVYITYFTTCLPVESKLTHGSDSGAVAPSTPSTQSHAGWLVAKRTYPHPTRIRICRWKEV
jgi:hypothetical protein